MFNIAMQLKSATQRKQNSSNVVLVHNKIFFVLFIIPF